MNNKDREALDKFVDEDYLSSEDTKRFAEMSDGERATFIAERFFEAGAKHGRSQLNELRDDNMSELYNVIKKLQEDNEKLVKALKFYADTNNWDAADGVHDSVISGVITGADHYEPWGEAGTAVGGKLAKQVLKEIGEE